MGKTEQLVTGNRLGIVFECGCRFGVQETFAKNRRQHIVCPKHKSRIKGYIYKCFECGRVFEDKSVRRARCDDCTQDVKSWYIKNQYLERKRIAEEGKENLGLPEKKPGFDQERRGDCRWGQYCVNNEVLHGEQFNCLNCKRFEPIESDVMAYVDTSKVCWHEAMSAC